MQIHVKFPPILSEDTELNETKIIQNDFLA